MTAKTVLYTPHACTLDDHSTAVSLHAMRGNFIAMRINSTNSPGGLGVSVHMSASEARRLAYELSRHAKAAEDVTDATADPIPETAA